MFCIDSLLPQEVWMWWITSALKCATRGRKTSHLLPISFCSRKHFPVLRKYLRGFPHIVGVIFVLTAIILRHLPTCFFYRVCSLQRLRQNLNGSPLNTSSGQNLLNFCDLIRIGVVPALPLQPTSHCRKHHIFGKLATSNFSRHENRISH